MKRSGGVGGAAGRRQVQMRDWRFRDVDAVDVRESLAAGRIVGRWRMSTGTCDSWPDRVLAYAHALAHHDR